MSVGSRVRALGPRTRGPVVAAGNGLVPERWRPAANDIARRLTAWPPVGLVRFGNLGRVSPIAPMSPPRYGRAIDRWYIDGFLEAESSWIRGDVLEVGDLGYTERFGGPDLASRSILQSPVGAGPDADYVADLADAPELPDQRFDCVVLPQTLLFIYDVGAAVATLRRILRPGGVALVTVPGISQSVPGDKEQWGQYWSFTDDSLSRLFGDEFGPEEVEITSRGNVLTAASFLYGLVVDDLRPHHFEVDDPAYPLILTVRARRSMH